ncbi:unnamed protein product [Sphagnum balticum]
MAAEAAAVELNLPIALRKGCSGSTDVVFVPEYQSLRIWLGPSLKNLILLHTSGTRICSKVLADLQELFQATVLEANAMLEASHQMISNPLQKHEPNKAGIVGKPTHQILAVYRINTWRFMLVSGSSVQTDIGKGDFQELDQMGIVKPSFWKCTQDF